MPKSLMIAAIGAALCFPANAQTFEQLKALAAIGEASAAAQRCPMVTLDDDKLHRYLSQNGLGLVQIIPNEPFGRYVVLQQARTLDELKDATSDEACDFGLRYYGPDDPQHADLLAIDEARMQESLRPTMENCHLSPPSEDCTSSAASSTAPNRSTSR